ncbi:hypothetical protein AB3N60_05345 [Leptospira sp. WS39.C2]
MIHFNPELKKIKFLAAIYFLFISCLSQDTQLEKPNPNLSFFIQNQILAEDPKTMEGEMNVKIHPPELIEDGVAKMKILEGEMETKRVFKLEPKNKFHIEQESLEIRIPSEDDANFSSNDFNSIGINTVSFITLGKYFNTNYQFKTKNQQTSGIVDSRFLIGGFKYKKNKSDPFQTDHLYEQELYPVLLYSDPYLFEIYDNKSHTRYTDISLSGNPILLYEPENKTALAVYSPFLIIQSQPNLSFANGEGFTRLLFRRSITTNEKNKTGTYMIISYRIEGLLANTSNQTKIVIRYLVYEIETEVGIDISPYGNKSEASNVYQTKKQLTKNFLNGKKQTNFLVEPDGLGCVKLGWLVYDTHSRLISESHENGICNTINSHTLNISNQKQGPIKEYYYKRFVSR